MPIHPLETTLFPEDLLDQLPQNGDRRWWAIYTKARQEKSLARNLLAYQVPFYLPLIPKDNIIRGKKIHSYLPLFGSYVFLFGSEEERARALTTNRISRILPVVDEPLLTHDLRQIRQLIASGAPLTIEQRLGPGRRVRIKRGPLMGIEGTVTARRNCHYLLVAVHFLQQAASLAIDRCMLEPVD